MESQKSISVLLDEIDPLLKGYQQSLSRNTKLRDGIELPSLIINAIGVSSIASAVGLQSSVLNIVSLSFGAVGLALQAVSKFYNVNQRIEIAKQNITKLRTLERQLKLQRIKASPDPVVIEDARRILDALDDSDSSVAEIDIPTPNDAMRVEVLPQP